METPQSHASGRGCGRSAESLQPHRRTASPRPEQIAAAKAVTAPPLARASGTAGFQVEARDGDWDASPITRASREIITIART